MTRSQQLAAAFVELADTFAAGFDLVDYAQLLTERCVELLAADASGVMLADKSGDLRVMATTLERVRTVELFELQIDEGPCLDCYRTGEAVPNVDLHDSADTWPVFTPAAVTAQFRSTSALPMRFGSEIIGALNLFCEERAALSDEDLSIAQAMADVATIGLLQKRSVEAHEILAGQLQVALDSRVLVEQAKGMLAARANISVSEAFRRLRTHARRHGLPLTQVATAVVDGSMDDKALASR